MAMRKVSECTKHCWTCVHFIKLSGFDKRGACCYIEHMGRRRPWPAGDGCHSFCLKPNRFVPDSPRGKELFNQLRAMEDEYLAAYE